MPTVRTPNPHFQGERLGVQFRDGEASVTEDQAKLLSDTYGYEIVEADDSEEDEAGRPTTDVKGIGPVLSAKLAQEGIETVSDLLDADTDDLALAMETTPESVIGWQTAAEELDQS